MSSSLLLPGVHAACEHLAALESRLASTAEPEESAASETTSNASTFASAQPQKPPAAVPCWWNPPANGSSSRKGPRGLIEDPPVSRTPAAPERRLGDAAAVRRLAGTSLTCRVDRGAAEVSS
ncbi:unnamed protein product [Ixodes pacificus]